MTLRSGLGWLWVSRLRKGVEAKRKKVSHHEILSNLPPGEMACFVYRLNLDMFVVFVWEVRLLWAFMEELYTYFQFFKE